MRQVLNLIRETLVSPGTLVALLQQWATLDRLVGGGGGGRSSAVCPSSETAASTVKTTQ